jgi:hypothetical protein
MKTTSSTADLVDVNHIGVTEHGGGDGLLLETAYALGVIGDLGGKDLQCNGAFELKVVR